jgi:large subunit ribosomal protein L24
MKMHVKTGDTVAIISGTDAGKTGKVIAVYPKTGRIMVEGINIITRHTKARNAQTPGGRIEKEAPINAAKAMLYCSKCKHGVRVNKKIDGDTKTRVCNKCGSSLDS